MNPNEQKLKEILEGFGAKIIEIEARCVGLESGILALAAALNMPVAKVQAAMDEVRRQQHEKRLADIERQNPSAAAGLDKRDIDDLPDQLS